MDKLQNIVKHIYFLEKTTKTLLIENYDDNETIHKSIEREKQNIWQDAQVHLIKKESEHN